MWIEKWQMDDSLVMFENVYAITVKKEHIHMQVL